MARRSPASTATLRASSAASSRPPTTRPRCPQPRHRASCADWEFSSRRQEEAHFAQRGLELNAVEEHVVLRPGELLLLDNLATAHGRLGLRAPLELHQLCVG